MAIKTTKEQLEEVQDAISNVLLGQSYTFKGRAMGMPDLAALQRYERHLKAEYNRECSDNLPILGSFDH